MKQRLIGAAVIVALAVLILPVLLDGTDEPVVEQIPPRIQHEFAPLSAVREPPRGVAAPDLDAPAPAAGPSTTSSAEPETTAAPQRPAENDGGPAAATSAIPAPQPPVKVAKAPAPSTPTATSLEPAPKPQAPVPEGLKAWVVQVASFQDRANAEALLGRLRKEGFRAQMREFRGQRTGAPVYRVFVGPEQDRARADQILAKLKTREGLESAYVARYP